MMRRRTRAAARGDQGSGAWWPQQRSIEHVAATVRPRWFVLLYVGLQVAVPTIMLIARWGPAGGACLPFGWQMYACG